MSITTRRATEQDKERCTWIESFATPGLSYINDVWEQFSNAPKGEFMVAEEDGIVGGFGMFSHLYGAYGWLEAGRVHPDFQSRGMGKGFYTRFMEKMVEEDITAVGMYTGIKNAVSKGLAERFGLSVQGEYEEFTKPLDPAAAAMHGFVPVSEAEGEALLAPHYAEMDAFAVLNRTFYPVREGLGAGYAREGWMYKDDEGNLIVAGCRFQPDKALHIAFLKGDTDKLLTCAEALAAKQGASGLTGMSANPATHKLFLDRGFTQGPGTFITLWKGL